MDAIVEHKLDACIRKHPEQGGEVALEKASDAVTFIDVLDGESESSKRAWRVREIKIKFKTQRKEGEEWVQEGVRG